MPQREEQGESSTEDFRVGCPMSTGVRRPEALAEQGDAVRRGLLATASAERGLSAWHGLLGSFRLDGVPRASHRRGVLPGPQARVDLGTSEGRCGAALSKWMRRLVAGLAAPLLTERAAAAESASDGASLPPCEDSESPQL